MKQNFFRILFLLIFNLLLFLTVKSNIYFIFPTLNFLVIFIIYEIYIIKKKYNEELEKINRSRNEDLFNVDYLPASEHPLIKAAKERLKN